MTPEQLTELKSLLRWKAATEPTRLVIAYDTPNGVSIDSLESLIAAYESLQAENARLREALEVRRTLDSTSVGYYRVPDDSREM